MRRSTAISASSRVRTLGCVISIGVTPLDCALHCRNVDTVRYLLDHGADPEKRGKYGTTALHLAAGAGPPLLRPRCNMCHFLFGGKLPIEIAAHHNRRKDVEILFPVTSRIPYVRDWSVDGILAYAKSLPKVEDDPLYKIGPAYLKSEGSKAYKRKDYVCAINLYTMATKHDPRDATLHSNTSLCWIKMGEGDMALESAEFCRAMRPDWPKACYRQGAAQMLLKNYEKACDAFSDGLKLDPMNVEIENALREALNSLKISRAKTFS
ncbi:hypothetical protein VPH35_068296 [Triticum aestivum]